MHLQLQPAHVLEGDRFMHGDRTVWVALEDAEAMGSTVGVHVNYPRHDSDSTYRCWRGPASQVELTIEREQ